jgi:hypothetical protein
MQVTTKFNLIWIFFYIHSSFKSNVFLFLFIFLIKTLLMTKPMILILCFLHFMNIFNMLHNSILCDWKYYDVVEKQVLSNVSPSSIQMLK